MLSRFKHAEKKEPDPAMDSPRHLDPIVATFSIAGVDSQAGDIGIAVASKFLSVGAVVPWAMAGVGAVATQAHANTTYGPEGLRLLAQDNGPDAVIQSLTGSDDQQSHRQLGIVSADGRAATFTGSACLDWAGGTSGDGYAIQGNILTGFGVVEAMEHAFLNSLGSLGDRLLEALRAGDTAGGDSRGRQSAALVVVRDQGGYGGLNDRYLDLRVDDHPTPVDELARLRDLHRLYFERPGAGGTIALSENLVREIQHILQRSGEYTGPPTGVYDDATQQALETRFAEENLEERWLDGAEIDGVALEYLRSQDR